MADSYFQSILSKISFFNLQENDNKCLNRKVVDKIILMNCITDEFNEEIFFICFHNTIITAKKSNFSQLIKFFHINQVSIIYCMTTDTKEKLTKMIDNSIQLEIIFFNKFQISKLSNYMKDKNSELIAAYLLQRSYINSQLDLNNSLGKKNPKPSLKQLDDNDYISISTLGKGSGGTVELVYSIKTELLYAMKIHYEQDSPLMKREIANYLKAKGQFIPRFYGTIIHESHQGFIIDYIAGHSLTKIKKLNIQDLYKLLMIL